jgi:lipopolysaccharide export system permease protein
LTRKGFSTLRGLQAIRYLFFETLPAFLMGLVIFLSILLMLQALRLTEFVLVHGVSLAVIGQIALYMSLSFLPVILPMSTLFSVLLTYNRLSNDSEIVALKSFGLSMATLTIPAVLLAAAATLMSAQTSFYLGPWGNRQLELVIGDLGRQKAAAAIKEGVFSEDFFDLVIYANKVDSRAGLLKDVFIYDERDPKAPVTIIAKNGQLIQEVKATGQAGLLRLNDGNIHRTHENTYTKVDFTSYDINLFSAFDKSQADKTPPSMTIQDLDQNLKNPSLEPKMRRRLELEYHRRWSMSAACMIFALLGVGLGTVSNRRSSRGGGFVVCLALLVAYWVCYAGADSMAQNGTMPAAVSLWLINGIFLAFALKILQRCWS